MKFRKKPVVIEAVKWDGTNVADIRAFFGAFEEWGLRGVHGEFLEIDTREGRMTGDPGDWIIRGVKGEYYPCKPDVFAASYEPA